MTSKGNTKEVTATMDKLSLNGRSKYLPPHLKYGSVPRPPPPSPPTPATSSINDTDQVTSTSSQQERVVPVPEKEQDTKPVPTMDSKKNYPHRKYAAGTATTKPASSIKEEDVTPVKEVEVTPAKEAEVTPATEADVAESWEEEASDIEPEQPKSEPDHVGSVKSEHAVSVKSEHAASVESKDTTTKPIDNMSSPKPLTSSLESTPQAPPAAPISNTSKFPISNTSKAPIDISNAPHHRYAKPTAPPPTPSSPSITGHSNSSRTSTPPDRRPEKTMAVANRLIAGALGVRAPRRTEEQRNYDKAVRDQEKKRRDAERESKKKADEDAARAKAAIWDD